MQKGSDIGCSHQEEIEIPFEVDFGFIIDDWDRLKSTFLGDDVSQREEDATGEHFSHEGILVKKTSVGLEHEKRRTWNFSLL